MGTLRRYLDVAGQLSASELAALAARRVYRSARQSLHAPNRAGVSPEGLASALGAAGPQALAEAAFAQRGLWCDVARREDTVAALRLLPGACERARARAEAAAARRVRLFGTLHVTVPAGDAEAWHREPLSGHLYPRVPAPALRLRVPGSDPSCPGRWAGWTCWWRWARATG